MIFDDFNGNYKQNYHPYVTNVQVNLDINCEC
jgi:hypothetical protein